MQSFGVPWCQVCPVNYEDYVKEKNLGVVSYIFVIKIFN